MKTTFLPFAIALVLIVFAFSCTQKEMQPKTTTINQDSIDYLNDSMEYVDALKIRDAFQWQVDADRETQFLDASVDSDAADDAAIWYDSKDWQNSKIIGTDKKGGLIVFDINGKIVQYQKVGKMNNVDLRYGFSINKQKEDIVVASNRTYNSLDVYKIDSKTGFLTDISAERIVISTKEIDDVYGVCLYKSSKTGKFFAYINGTNGMVHQYELSTNDKQFVIATKVREFKFQSQVEGMVADDNLGWLYVGVEEVGVFKVSAEPNLPFQPQIIKGSSDTNAAIAYDIEGLAIYQTGSDKGYLIASSQGNFSYAVFDRAGENSYLGSFIIRDGAFDGVEETDGIEVSSFSFGENFPSGFLLVQDGFNFDNGKKQAQNFKIIDWRKIEMFFVKE